MYIKHSYLITGNGQDFANGSKYTPILMLSSPQGLKSVLLLWRKNTFQGKSIIVGTDF